jgi:hypothetical protein
MTAPLPATAAEGRETGAWRPGLLPRFFAVFMALHGLVHVVGFTVPWGLGGPKGVEYRTTLLNGFIEVGHTAVKLIGFVWVAAALGFVVVAVMLWRGRPWARPSTVAALLGSLVLCLAGLPASVMGLGIDVVTLGLLLVASEKLIPRRADRAGGSAA